MSAKRNIVITGAPSSGKSSVMAELQRILGNQVVLVPESAVLLLGGGFPAPEHNDIEQIRAFQKAILQVQKSLELVFKKKNPNADIMIFERGALDGASFWPAGTENFLTEFKLNVTKELALYQYVLFFELPNQQFFGGINHLRFHNYEQCLESEKGLKKLWSRHPHFIEIKATEIFEDKIQAAIDVVKTIIQNP